MRFVCRKKSMYPQECEKSQKDHQSIKGNARRAKIAFGGRFGIVFINNLRPISCVSNYTALYLL